MNQIEHDPHEPKVDRSNGIWWLSFIIIGLLWIGQWYFHGFDWGQIALGGGSGMILAAWAIEKTGNKIPDSWRDAARRSRR